MSNSTKNLLVVFIILLVVTVLAACGKGKSPNPVTPIPPVDSTNPPDDNVEPPSEDDEEESEEECDEDYRPSYRHLKLRTYKLSKLNYCANVKNYSFRRISNKTVGVYKGSNCKARKLVGLLRKFPVRLAKNLYVYKTGKGKKTKLIVLVYRND